MKLILFPIFMLLSFTLYAQPGNIKKPRIDPEVIFVSPPQWTQGSTIYEVNLRQYSESGSFKDFATHIPRLKAMGVDILWFMPIHPIGMKERKGSLGSYYSVQDYKGVNPEHGTMDDFKALVKTIHDAGMHIILDWVANHTAADHPWVKTHPEYYTKDSAGRIVPPVADWSDVLDLDYTNKEMRAEMISSMQFWLTETGIDGFRCDVAEMVPIDFWLECSRALRLTRPDVFLLAEGEKAELHFAFHMTYTWQAFHIWNSIVKGEKKADDLRSYISEQKKAWPTVGYRMYFTSNHDENSWNGTEFERMKEAVDLYATMSIFLPGMPLVYTGQEVSLNRRLKFFDKDPVSWSDLNREDFYKQLLHVKQSHESLKSCRNSVGLIELKHTASSDVIVWKRTGGGRESVALFNLSNKPQKGTVEGFEPGAFKTLLGNYQSGKLKGNEFDLPAWGYMLLGN